MTTNNHPGTSPTPSGSTCAAPAGIRLRSGRKAGTGFYDALKENVLDRASALDPAVIYKAAKVCGKDFWGYLEDGERNLAGECILHMALHGEVPLEPAGKDSENHQLYRVANGYHGNEPKEVAAAQ
jgi:hypothetical protein